MIITIEDPLKDSLLILIVLLLMISLGAIIGFSDAFNRGKKSVIQDWNFFDFNKTDKNGRDTIN